MALIRHLTGSGALTDPLVRRGLGRGLRRRIREIERDTDQQRRALIDDLVAEMHRSPLAGRPAPATPDPPLDLQRLVLGSRLKSSCCFWPAGTADLDAAEVAMLERTASNACLEDGMAILDLGAGWGSMALWLAAARPASRVVAVCATADQRALVATSAEARSLANLEVVAADPLRFETGDRFDRVLAIETLERTRNYRELLRRIAGWLLPGGRVLIQSACHRRWPYFYEPDDPGGFAATGAAAAGLMPSDDLLYRFDRHLEIEHHASFSGEHYQRTADAWLRNLGRRRREIEDGSGLYARWRRRLLACSEQFGCHRGQEWWINHCLLRPAGGR